MPTTRKETRSVVPKRDVVTRERGWRWGAIAERRGRADCYLGFIGKLGQYQRDQQ